MGAAEGQREAQTPLAWLALREAVCCGGGRWGAEAAQEAAPRQRGAQQRGDCAAQARGPWERVRPGARAGCALCPEAAGPRLRPRLVVFKARLGARRAGVGGESPGSAGAGSRAGGRGPRSHAGPQAPPRPRDPKRTARLRRPCPRGRRAETVRAAPLGPGLPLHGQSWRGAGPGRDMLHGQERQTSG